MKRCRKVTRKRGGSFREHLQKAKETVGEVGKHISERARTHSKNLGDKFNNWKKENATIFNEFKEVKRQKYEKWKEGKVGKNGSWKEHLKRLKRKYMRIYSNAHKLPGRYADMNGIIGELSLREWRFLKSAIVEMADALNKKKNPPKRMTDKERFGMFNAVGFSEKIPEGSEEAEKKGTEARLRKTDGIEMTSSDASIELAKPKPKPKPKPWNSGRRNHRSTRRHIGTTAHRQRTGDYTDTL
tara:strand:- start:9643 stop:10368 length:726 start_codon:yes stop_codon:yes gene_type:complete